MRCAASVKEGSLADFAARKAKGRFDENRMVKEEKLPIPYGTNPEGVAKGGDRDIVCVRAYCPDTPLI